MTFALRPDQERVAAYRSGYMGVPAVPGAGKTTVLAYLAAELIAGGFPAPGRILIVTYTNSAVGNIKGRIGEFLEQRGLPRTGGYEVRTIHSLALQIVRERPEAIGWADTFTVADEVQLNDILTRITTSWIARNRTLWSGLMRADLTGARKVNAEQQWADRTRSLVRSLIQSFKSRRLAPQTACDLTRHLSDTSALRWAAEVYVEYQRELAALGAVDFGDLMLGAHDLLAANTDLLVRLQRRWTYLFEDEAQDSYRLQEQVLRLLAGPDGNLVRVGDANQAIMGTFTSAEPDLFRRFCADPAVAVRPLTMAGRSSPDVINLANELVRWTREAHHEPALRTALEPQFIESVPPDFEPANPRPDRYKIFTRVYDSSETELATLARMAGDMLTRHPEGTMAVLLPTNGLATGLTDHLTAAGIPFRQLGGATVPERQRTSLDLLAILGFLAEPQWPGRLVAALSRLLGLHTPDELPPFLTGCPPEALFYPADGAPPFEVLYTACPECRHDPALEGALAMLARWLTQTLLPPDQLVIHIAADLGLAGEELALAHYLTMRVRGLLREQPGFTLTDVAAALPGELQAMGRFADNLYDRQGFKPVPGLVYVATCHAAKGLEWDTVFVGALTRAEYPSVLSDKVRSEHWFLPDDLVNPEALAIAELDAVLGDMPGDDPVVRAKLEVIGERLRLLYVALTRARENLLLTYHRQDRFARKSHPTLALVALKPFIDGHAAPPPAQEG